MTKPKISLVETYDKLGSFLDNELKLEVTYQFQLLLMFSCTLINYKKFQNKEECIEFAQNAISTYLSDYIDFTEEFMKKN